MAARDHGNLVPGVDGAAWIHVYLSSRELFVVCCVLLKTVPSVCVCCEEKLKVLVPEDA